MLTPCQVEHGNWLHVDPPPHAKVRVGSAGLSEVDPVQYQADLVVVLEDEVPLLGIVVEVQLARDQDKRLLTAATLQESLGPH